MKMSLASHHPVFSSPFCPSTFHMDDIKRPLVGVALDDGLPSLQKQEPNASLFAVNPLPQTFDYTKQDG